MSIIVTALFIGVLLNCYLVAIEYGQIFDFVRTRFIDTVIKSKDTRLRRAAAKWLGDCEACFCVFWSNMSAAAAFAITGDVQWLVLAPLIVLAQRNTRFTP